MFACSTATRTGVAGAEQRRVRQTRPAPDRACPRRARATAGATPPPPAVALDDDVRRRSGGQRQQQREAIDAGDARQLGDRQPGHLAVAEQRPRKPVPHVLPPELGRDPGRRGEQRRRGPHRPRAARDHHRTRRRKQRQICHEQERGEHRHRSRQAAERRHRLDEPVERDGEVDAAGEEAERERASRARGRWSAAVPAAHQRDDQRRQGEPGARRVPELRETERQQGAREKS